MVTRARPSYTRYFLTPGMCSLIKPATMVKLMCNFPPKSTQSCYNLLPPPLSALVSHFSLKCYIETILLINPHHVSGLLCCMLSLLTEFIYHLEELGLSHLNPLLPAFTHVFFKQVNTGPGNVLTHMPTIIGANAGPKITFMCLLNYWKCRFSPRNIPK